MTGIYSAFVLILMWVLPLFPAQPKLGRCTRTSRIWCRCHSRSCSSSGVLSRFAFAYIQGRAQVAAGRFRRRGIPGDSDCRAMALRHFSDVVHGAEQVLFYH